MTNPVIPKALSNASHRFEFSCFVRGKTHRLLLTYRSHHRSSLSPPGAFALSAFFRSTARHDFFSVTLLRFRLLSCPVSMAQHTDLPFLPCCRIPRSQDSFYSQLNNTCMPRCYKFTIADNPELDNLIWIAFHTAIRQPS